jgi:arylsulfatase A-like enzyme
MTDQQRWDAMSAAGNNVLDTPNMDRIGADGVRFELCYSPCPVCGPARASLMTGRTIENTRVRTNMDADIPDICPMPSYDERLADRGYRTEYHGKWNVPLGRALTYDNAVTPGSVRDWERGPGMSLHYAQYLDKHFPRLEITGRFSRCYRSKLSMPPELGEFYLNIGEGWFGLWLLLKGGKNTSALPNT